MTKGLQVFRPVPVTLQAVDLRPALAVAKLVKNIQQRALLGAIMAVWLGGSAPQPNDTLSVEVTNVRNAKGRVHIDVCPEAKFLKADCPYAATAPAVIGTTIVTIRGIPPGRYAVQAFHDENANDKVDRAIFGVPREGVGFSNDAPIRFSPPKWADAVFVVDRANQTIRLKLRYFL
jgi:uncharacterized protein (DUF2141 family)